MGLETTMKACLMTSLLLCFHAHLKAETIRTRYSNGNILSEVSDTDGKINGSYTAWYKNGTKATEGYFVNDSREGLWKEWYQNGQIAVEQHFTDDQLNGDFQMWYQNGKCCIKGYYRKNVRDSAWTYYHENGKIKYKADFHFGIASQWGYSSPQWNDSTHTECSDVYNSTYRYKKFLPVEYLKTKLFNLVCLPGLNNEDSTRWLWLSDYEQESFEGNIYIGGNGLTRKYWANSSGDGRLKVPLDISMFWQDQIKHHPCGRANGTHIRMHRKQSQYPRKLVTSYKCAFSASYTFKNHEVTENIVYKTCPCLYCGEEFFDTAGNKDRKKPVSSDPHVYLSGLLIYLGSKNEVAIKGFINEILSDPYLNIGFTDTSTGRMKLVSRKHKNPNKKIPLFGSDFRINPQKYWFDVEAKYANGKTLFKGKTSSKLFGKWHFYADNGNKIAEGEYFYPDIHIPDFVYEYFIHFQSPLKNGVWNTWSSDGKPMARYNFYKGWLIGYKEY